MSDLFSMVVNAYVLDQATGEVLGMVTGVDTIGNRMKIKIHVFEEDDEWDDDPDDGEKEPIPEEEEKPADATIGENITRLKLKTGTEDK